MGWQIIKQEATDLRIDGQSVEAGKFCVRSSVVDNLIAFNLDEADIVAMFVHETTRNTVRSVLGKLRHVEAGEPDKAYYQFALTWAEALAESQVGKS